MPVSLPRRLALAVTGLVLLGAAALAGAMWSIGSRNWPPHERTPTPRLASDPAEVAAALAKTPAAVPLRIGVIGDIQNGTSELADVLDETVKRRCNFILLLGDCANVGLPGRYALLRAIFHEHAPGIPVLAVPGNHDIEPSHTTEVWKEWVGPAAWSVETHGWRILGLDDADGPLTAESLALANSAAGAARVLVVAHRPLGAAKSEPYEGIEMRAKQLTSAGSVPALVLSGHWHENADWTDPTTGTRHVLLGENCDRASHGPDPPVTAATLTLSDGPPVFEVWRIPRRIGVSDEFVRLAVGDVYPACREHPLVTWSGIVGVAGIGLLCLVRSIRRGTAAQPAA